MTAPYLCFLIFVATDQNGILASLVCRKQLILDFEVKHIQCVLIAYFFDDVLEDPMIIGEPSAFYFRAEIITEDPSEIFVPGIRQEAS